jgi:hypothetical protein
VLVLGSLIALLAGVLYAGAAALEKHQGMRFGTGRHGLALLATLARRPLWALGIALSALAWAGEAAALALAPVPVVATLRNAGRGLLVVGGGRWLEERFSRLELAGVAATALGGALTAVGSSGVDVVRRPLANLTEVEVGAGCAFAAALVAWAGGRLARPRPGLGPRGAERRANLAGVAVGVAVGALFAGTGVFTKEIGDRFALYGAGGLVAAAASFSPWLMVAMAVWSQSLVQQAYRLANAATVAAANASVSSLGLIAAGFFVYGEDLPGGWEEVVLLAGMAIAIAGTVLLLATRPNEREPEKPQVEGEPALAS